MWRGPKTFDSCESQLRQKQIDYSKPVGSEPQPANLTTKRAGENLSRFASYLSAQA